jgi:DNA-binding CsgD family transcriptional regulator
MAWLDQADLHAAERLPFALDETQTPLELMRSALEELARVVPSDLTSWNRIALSTGAVEHEAAPAGAEPRLAFQEVSSTASRHPLLHAHALNPRAAVRLSDAIEPRRLQRSELYGELLHRSGGEYGISIAVRPYPGETLVFALGRHEREFSERDRDVLDLARPGLEHTLRLAEARQRLLLALASDPPAGTGVVLLDDSGEIQYSSPDADRWLAEHFGAGEHPGWLPEPVASWLALPPRPALESVREGRRLTIRLLPGDPHALLVEEEVARFRAGALAQLGLTGREREVLEAARATGAGDQSGGAYAQSDLADELFLSLHAVHERLQRLEGKLGVHTLPEAIAAARRASL